MKIAATIQLAEQTGQDTWTNILKTKIFEEWACVGDILKWAQTHAPGITFSMIRFSEVE